MQSKTFRTLLHQSAVSLRQLSTGHTVFGVFWLIHNMITDRELSARIIAAADRFRNSAGRFQRVDQRKVIQIDDRALSIGSRKLAPLRFIGRKHDLMTGKP